MSTRVQKAKGFTLVEILIVVVILGILAAIVIPQFTNASESAKASSLISQLQTIRGQLELYQIQHNGDYPDLINEGWTQITQTTNVAGEVSGDDFGPYMQQAPRNPFEGSASVAALGSAAQGVGWVYDINTGEIQAVIESTKATDVGFDASSGGDQEADIDTY